MEYGETQMSVKWLETKIQKEIAMYGSISPKMISILAEQAIAIHKKEIERAYYEGIVIVMSKPDDDMLQLSQQYYNETFGGNNES